MLSLNPFPSTHSHHSLSKLFPFPPSQAALIPAFLRSRLSDRLPAAPLRLHGPGRSRCASVSAAATTSSTPSSAPVAPKGGKVGSVSLGDITRRDFPILHQEVNGFPLVYFDNGATSQKPLTVLKALSKYYEEYNSNVHRGIHSLSAKATDAYEQAREKVAKFINASHHAEVIFTRNATEAINLVAYSWGLSNLKSGDEIILTIAEHHSAIVPWQFVAQKTGAILKYVMLTDQGVPDLEQLKKMISERTKLVAVQHVSNVLGMMNPVEDIVAWAHNVGAKTLIDACQSVPHMAVDVQSMDADFLVASSHKMCGPTGVGFLYAKHELLTMMPPFLGGGEMISDVFEDYSTYADPPSRFEAGTPAIGEAIGLGAAIDYLSGIGMKNIHDYEKDLAKYLYEQLNTIPNVCIYGPAPDSVYRAPLCSFNVKNIHPTDIATILDEQHGIAIRSGHHCAQPLHRYLGVNASARASLHFYNTREEIDVFIAALKDTINFFTSYQLYRCFCIFRRRHKKTSQLCIIQNMEHTTLPGYSRS